MIPEIAPRTGYNCSGRIYRDRNSVTNPNAKTLIVWVNVTIAPRNAACLNDPLEPTRYAATIVFPCPGEKACIAPSPNATARPIRIMLKLISLRLNNSDRKSPRTTVPPACGAAGIAAATGVGFVTSAGSTFAATTGSASEVHCTDAFKTCGEETVASCGYTLNPLLRSSVPALLLPSVAPLPEATTTSFQPARSG